ncbi:MAG: DUF1064 domain-containing protein [Patescibacteria group bacterium]
MTHFQYGKYHVSSPEERTRDGIEFASKAEMRRYGELKLLEKVGKIRDLSMQPRYLLFPGFKRNGISYKPIHYVGDFLYYDKVKKRKIVEDVKGVETEVFKIKHKLFVNRFNIELRIVKTSEIR